MNRKNKKELKRLCKTYLIDYDFVYQQCINARAITGTTDTKFINNFFKIEYFYIMVVRHMHEYTSNENNSKENRAEIEELFNQQQLKKGLLKLIEFGGDNLELYIKLWKGRPWTWRK